MRDVRRSPVMVPSAQARRGLAVVRRRRLLVEDGALVLQWESGRREVLAARGEVWRAWWTPVAVAAGLPIPKATAAINVTDLLVLERRTARPLVLRLSDWFPASRPTPLEVTTGRDVAGWPGPPEEPSLSAAVRISGAAALVDALGPGLDSAAGGDRLVALRRVLAGGRQEVPGVVGVPAALAVPCVAGHAIAVTGMLLLVLGIGTPAGAYLVVQVAGLLAAGVVAGRTVLRVLGARERDRVYLPVAPWRPAPTVPTSRWFVKRALLAAGPDWLVVRDQHDREGWTPGPSLGGVRTVWVAWPWLSFNDEADVSLWQVKADEWFGKSELPARLAQLRGAGYEVTGDGATVTMPRPGRGWSASRRRPRGRRDGWFSVPILPGQGRNQEALGTFGLWSDGAFGMAALSFALQARLAVEREQIAMLVVLPGLAVLVGVVEIVLSRLRKRGTWVAVKPKRLRRLWQG